MVQELWSSWGNAWLPPALTISLQSCCQHLPAFVAHSVAGDGGRREGGDFGGGRSLWRLLPFGGAKRKTSPVRMSQFGPLRAEKEAAGMWPSILLIIIQNQSEHSAESLSQISTEHNTAANALSPHTSSPVALLAASRGLIHEKPCQPSCDIQHVSAAAPLGIKWKHHCWTPPITQIHSGHLRPSALSQCAVQIHGTSFLFNFAGHQVHNCPQQKAMRKLQKELC